MSQDLYEVLYQNDQLFIERQLGNIPQYFREGKIEFAPTFKRKAGDNNAYGMKRNPSWTDRILFSCSCDHKDRDTCRLEQKSYDSNNLVTISDHRPVHAQFIYRLELSKVVTDREGDKSPPILPSLAQGERKEEQAESNGRSVKG